MKLMISLCVRQEMCIRDSIEDARKEAESIVNSSRKSADELAENTKSELKLFAGQAVNALKSEIASA